MCVWPWSRTSPGCRGVYVLNPGSVSIPKAGSWHGYMTLENGVFTWKTLSGDVRDTLRL